MRLLEQMNTMATGGLETDLTIVLDLSAEDGLLRKREDQRDRLENEGIEFHNKVREGYLAIARRSPERVKVIDAKGCVEDVHLSIKKCVDHRLADFQTTEDISGDIQCFPT